MLMHSRYFSSPWMLWHVMILILLSVGTVGMTAARVAATEQGDATATAAAQTIEAAMEATLTPTPTATPNKNGTATALAAQIQTAVIVALTANPTATPTATPTPAQAAQIQTAVAATLTAQAAAPPTTTPTPAQAAQVQTAVAATLTANPAPPTDASPATQAPTQRPTKTPRPTAPPKATKPPAPPATATPAAPVRPDLVTDFEQLRGAWQRGNEGWGTLTPSTENKTSGTMAMKLVYDFTPAQPENDFVIFLRKPPLNIPGQPKGLTLEVYGDGSGNFLNAWVQDSVGQIWQFTFGRINHTGWQIMSAPLDPDLGWPNSVVQNNQSTALTYPLHFYALVLDGEPRQVLQGSLFFDDLLTTDTPARPNLGGGAAPAPTPTTSGSTTPNSVPDTAPNESCAADPASITAGQTALVYWKFTGVKEVYFEQEGVLGIGSKLVKPGQTTTYTVHVVREDGSETSCQITVQVH